MSSYIVGFLQDNYYEYYLFDEQPQHKGEPVEYPEPKKPYFNREWIREQCIFVLERIAEEENIFVVGDNLETVQGADEKHTEQFLREYIN